MKQTFWNLLKSEQKIEIPEIQRDYVQGRKNDRVTAIREKFVKDLLSHIDINNSKSNNPLHLDFVFGQSVDINTKENFERSKENLVQMIKVLEEFSKDNKISFNAKVSPKPTKIKGDTLIPIDGQQRLTTLFLLHWYIRSNIDGTDKDDFERLKRFTYKTRQSSTEFIVKLVEKGRDVVNNANSHNSNLSDEIKDQSWFFSSWKKDPTVSGMLVMIDEIQNQTLNWDTTKFNEAWRLLTEKDKICFDFFDIEEAGLEDDLYLKMNSRGKHLTDFENFKAWLQKNFKDDNNLSDEWHKKLDKDWLDIMWSANSDIAKIDENYLSFFENMALIDKLKYFKIKDNKLHYSENKADQSEAEQIEKAEDIFNKLSNREFLPTKYYEVNNVFNKSSVQFIFSVLTLFEGCEDRIDSVVQPIWNYTFYNSKINQENKISKALFSDFSMLDYSDKTFIYALLKFLLVKEKPFYEYNHDDLANFEDWIRVIRNLIYNTNIDVNRLFVQAIHAINNISVDAVISITSFLKKQEEDRWISFFNGNQLREERIKACLSEEWKVAIIEAENHYYFYGQVLFILNLSKAHNGDYNLQQFQYYYESLRNLFKANHLDDNNYLIQRALFTVDSSGDWMKWKTAWRRNLYRSLRANNRDRDENWRALFINDEESNRLDILKTLLDQCDCTTESLIALIEKNKANIKDWRSYFIHMPELIHYCKQKLLNWWGGNHFIRLLSTSRLSGYHVELRSYALYKHLKKNESFKDLIKYDPVMSSSERPCLLYKNEGCKFRIWYVRVDNNYGSMAGNFVVKKYDGGKEVINFNAKEELPFYSEIIDFYTSHENLNMPEEEFITTG